MIETDALIIGAGPVGLFQVFELGLQEVRAEVVDSLPRAGGQCVELYGDKPIYDIPGLARTTGRELVERLQAQIAPFDAGLHLGRQVSELTVRDDGRFDAATSAGDRFVATAVVVAGGVGSFQPRRLRIAGLDRYRGSQLHEHADQSVGRAHGRVVIVGGGESAVAAALAIAGSSDRRRGPVTLVHRRDDFDADPASLVRLAEARSAGLVEFVAGQPEAIVERDGALVGIDVLCADASTRTLPVDSLFVLLGWSPKLGPIAEWGLALERKQLVVDTERFETSTRGVFAVGDVNTYPGKRKLIVCGFHEATLAAFAIGERVFPDRAEPLQYTTTSARLQRVLKVAKG